jgi:UDP-N-acetylmuramoyl-tripeptide--D-alanyl-D-alanine ligase
VDTRTQNAGDVYFALRGPNFDGHEFVPAAIDRGAAAVVVEHFDQSRDRKGAVQQGSDSSVPLPDGCGSVLVVPDTLRALQDLARWARGQWGGTVVGVTGSAGKTTTKDAIAHLLGSEMAVGRTIGNLNNHVGVPLSILRLPEDARVAVLEMGMNHAGEIRELAGIAGPNIGVVTNVGYAHVEFFDSIDGVAAAKRELIESLQPDGVAVLNADDPRVSRFGAFHSGRSITFGFSEGADVRAESSEFAAEGSRFRALGVDYETSLTGRHGVLNLLAALAVSTVFGIAPERLRDAVGSFAVGKMRGEKLEHNGILVWNDCYNSNPEAARSMLDVLAAAPGGRRIAVLGEMLELGRAAGDLHRQIGRYAATSGVDLLVGIRGHARDMIEAARAAGLANGSAVFFEDAEEAGEFARSAARRGDAILFKGSRGVHVERALERFLS